MHILEQYAVNCGVKIGKPFISPEFYPLNFQGKYICLHAGSGMDSKNYDYFDEVVDLIRPHLEQKNIKIVQIGGPKERLVKGCYPALGSTKRQMAYLLQNSELYFGNDTMSLHFASHFQKKIVCVSTVLYTSNFYPYWSRKDDYSIIESHRNGNKPTFSAFESPKSINFINPEEIAKEILKFLNIKNNLEIYKTLNIGQFYNTKGFNVIPDHVVSPEFTQNVVYRMDIAHNEENLYNQSKILKTVINCNQKIDLNILKENKDNIVGINVFVQDDENLDFVKEIKKLNIKYQIFSYLDDKDLNKYKIKFIDYGAILKLKTSFPELEEKLKNVKTPLFYKSNTFILSKGDIYLSEKAFFDQKPISSFNENIQEFYDFNILRENPDKFYIFTMDLTS
jgi:hypothetical protein